MTRNSGVGGRVNILMFLTLRGTKGPELVTPPVFTMPRHRRPLEFIIAVALVSAASAFTAPHSFHRDITRACQTLRMIAQDEPPNRCREVSLVLANALCPSSSLNVMWTVSLVRVGILRKEGVVSENDLLRRCVEQRKATLEDGVFHSRHPAQYLIPNLVSVLITSRRFCLAFASYPSCLRVEEVPSTPGSEIGSGLI